ncbi:MAG: DUF3373 domain-containing protein [Desulfuromonadales bacterium]
MRTKMVRMLILSAVFATVAGPLTARAAEDDLQKKVDQLVKEVQELKSQVKKTDDKSLGKWLTINGEYRFRVDSLHGETVAYSSALGTMKSMVGDFLTGPNAAAISGPNGFASYALMSESGKLFSPTQFSTILGTYMPNAMYGGFTSNAFLTQFNTILSAGQPGVAGALSGSALTAQQAGILNTLTSYGVMDKVFAMPASANIKMGGVQVPGATLGAQWNNMMTGLAGRGLNPAQVTQLAQQMLLQGFLGAGSPYLTPNQIAAYKPKNETLYTNKFGLNLSVKATQDITVNAKLDMYKAFGSQSDAAVTGNYFADRVGVFDGTLGHVANDSLLNVDRAYATWSNIAEQPLWFSVGRRPSTNGAPSNLRLNRERPGNGGTPALLVDYAFDGMTIGYAPDIDALPGAYAKICYGRGFDSGLKTSGNSIKDTDMLGIAVIPVDTDPLRVWLQWNRGFNIFDFPVMNNTLFGNTAPATNLGDIDWYGAGVMSTLKNIGPGKLNLFTDFGISVSHPNNNVSTNAGFQGLMTGQFFAQEAPSSKTGWAVYAGVRYDLPSRTKLGFEFNHGSRDWITFAPAADDMWTSKVGTRGNVYEPYIIQELNLKPVSSYFSKAFFKLGYQYYDFEYTGSNNWVGSPQKISSIQSTDLMLLAPLKEAHNIYGTLEVHF